MANCRSDIYQRAKQLVSIRDLLEREGLHPNHSGMVSCPVHGRDSTPSLKVYPNGRGWYCFGCGRGGDVVNLAALLYGCDNGTAVRQLDERFGLDLFEPMTPDKARKYAAEAYQRRYEREAQKREYARHEAEFDRLASIVRKGPDDDDPWAYCEAQEKIVVVEEWLGDHRHWR